MPNGAVASPNGEVTPQSDSFLGMLIELLKGRWTEREEQTGQSMGIQNVAALSALEFLKPPQKMVPTKNPKLLKMGLKEEMNPAYLEMIAMGTMGKPKGVSGPKTPAIKQTSIKDIIQEGIDEYPSTDAADSHVSKLMQYIRSGEKLPPIVVSPSKYLSDGRHRLEAYRRLGYKKVPTVEGYHVGTSSVTTKSGKKIPLEKVSVEGQEFLRKVKKAQVSKPSAPTPVKWRKSTKYDQKHFSDETFQLQLETPAEFGYPAKPGKPQEYRWSYWNYSRNATYDKPLAEVAGTFQTKRANYKLHLERKADYGWTDLDQINFVTKKDMMEFIKRASDEFEGGGYTIFGEQDYLLKKVHRD